MLFISPDQLHALQGRGEAPIVVVLVIRPGVIRAIGNRHEDLNGVAFWGDSTTPTIAHHDMRQLAALNQAALKLERAPRSKLHLEAFLLPLLVALDRPPEQIEPGARLVGYRLRRSP